MEEIQVSLEQITAPFPRITYDDAITFLHDKGFDDIKWGDDFGAPHETAIAENYEKPVFITHYPTSLNHFICNQIHNRDEVVLCADLIAPEGYGEIIGGSERVYDYELLKKQIGIEHQLDDRSL